VELLREISLYMHLQGASVPGAVNSSQKREREIKERLFGRVLCSGVSHSSRTVPRLSCQRRRVLDRKVGRGC